MYNYCSLLQVASTQASFIAAAIMKGHVSLPTIDEMEQEIEKEMNDHLATGQPPKAIHNLLAHQRQYCHSLESMGQLKPLPEVMHNILDELIVIALVEKNYISMRKLNIEPIDDKDFKVTEIE